MIVVKKITTPEKYQIILDLAREDGHSPIYPTFEISKDGRTIGCASIGSMMVSDVWVSTKEATARDSLEALRQGEGIAKSAGVGVYMMPCVKSSPFYPFMSRLGFTNYGETTIFLKDLGG